jgi:hypothetical protein
MIDWKRISRNDVAMSLLRLLYGMGGEQQGYELMSNCDAPYAQAKITLQNLRQEGVVLVVKEGPPGKKSWIAYQRVALSDEATRYIDDIEGAIDKKVDDAKRFANALNGKRRAVGVGWLDDPEKRAILRTAVAMGWVGLRVEGKAHEG